MPNARVFGTINMPFQRIPPGESLHTTTDHQSTPEHIRPSLDAFLISHALFDALSIRVSPIHSNPTTYPLFRLHPTNVSFNMTPKVRNAFVFLAMVAPDDGALKVRPTVDEQGGILALEVTIGDFGFVAVGVGAPQTARSAALLRLGGGGRRGRNRHATGRLPLGDCLAPLLPLAGGLVVLVVITRGRNIVTVAIRVGTIKARRGRRGGGRRG